MERHESECFLYEINKKFNSVYDDDITTSKEGYRRKRLKSYELMDFHFFPSIQSAIVDVHCDTRVRYRSVHFHLLGFSLFSLYPPNMLVLISNGKSTMDEFVGLLLRSVGFLRFLD